MHYIMRQAAGRGVSYLLENIKPLAGHNDSIAWQNHFMGFQCVTVTRCRGRHNMHHKMWARTSFSEMWPGHICEMHSLIHRKRSAAANIAIARVTDNNNYNNNNKMYEPPTKRNVRMFDGVQWPPANRINLRDMWARTHTHTRSTPFTMF